MPRPRKKGFDSLTHATTPTDAFVRLVKRAGPPGAFTYWAIREVLGRAGKAEISFAEFYQEKTKFYPGIISEARADQLVTAATEAGLLDREAWEASKIIRSLETAAELQRGERARETERRKHAKYRVKTPDSGNILDTDHDLQKIGSTSLVGAKRESEGERGEIADFTLQNPDTLVPYPDNDPETCIRLSAKQAAKLETILGFDTLTWLVSDANDFAINLPAKFRRYKDHYRFLRGRDRWYRGQGKKFVSGHPELGTGYFPLRDVAPRGGIRR